MRGGSPIAGCNQGAALLLLVTTAAGPPPAAAALEIALAGHWSGTLAYRDYQNNALSKLKMQTTIRAGADRVTAIRESAFDEGPGRTPAYITTGSLYDPANGTVAVVSLRKGRAADLANDRQRVTAFVDATHWTIVDKSDSQDDGRPARLRVTEVRDGDRLTVTKDVRPDGATAFAFRNVTELTRTGD